MDNAEPKGKKARTTSRWIAGLMIGLMIAGAVAGISVPPPQSGGIPDAPTVSLPQYSNAHLHLNIQETDGGANSGWIQVLAFSWGVHGAPASVGSTAGATSGRATHEDLFVMKTLDQFSAMLARYVAIGKHLSKVTFEVYADTE